MFIFQKKDSSWAVALDNTHDVVVMYNSVTNELVTSVSHMVDILHYSYAHSIRDEVHTIPETSHHYGGRKWSSLKYAVAERLGLSRAEMKSIIKGDSISAYLKGINREYYPRSK